MHGHSPAWRLEADTEPPVAIGHTIGGAPVWGGSGITRYLLDIDLTTAQAELLTSQHVQGGGPYRGDPVLAWPSAWQSGCSADVRVTGIQLTADEAFLVGQGTHPLDVLFPVWPEYGYRLVAVPERLSG